MRLIGVLAGAAIALPTLFAPNASAATEFGDDCLATGGEPGYTLTQLARGSGSTLPLTAPSDGVITSWTVRIAPGFAIEAEPVRLKILRATPNPVAFRVVGESADASAAMPAFTQNTRIPVQSADRLALYSLNGTPFCATDTTGDSLGAYKGDALNGFEYAFAPVAKFRLPVSARLESDLDGDGYGDESQDACPKSAAYHEGCPVIRLEIAEFWAKRHSIVLHIAASSTAKVQVFGQVGWGFRPKRPPNKGKPTQLIVGLRGGAKTVRAGKEAVFRVQLPKTVLLRLSRIGPHQSLKAKLTATTTDLAGRVVKERLTVRLKGWGSDA